MVVGTLESDIQGDGQTSPVCLFNQTIKVVDCPQLGVNRLMAALGRTDGPRTANVGRRRTQRIVLPLAVPNADGMDWWQVKNVEAHLTEAIKLCYDVAECAMSAFFRSAGARKQLIPSAEPRQLRINADA